MRFAIVALVLATFGCKPHLHEGSHTGAKYEIESTDVKEVDHHIVVSHREGWWFTSAGSARNLQFYDVRNAGTEAMCISMILSQPGEVTMDWGLWFPTENFVLHPGQTRTQAAGLASSRSDGTGTDLELELTSWRAAADPECKNH